MPMLSILAFASSFCCAAGLSYGLLSRQNYDLTFSYISRGAVLGLLTHLVIALGYGLVAYLLPLVEKDSWFGVIMLWHAVIGILFGVVGGIVGGIIASSYRSL
ncbi:hypothetical protein EYB53_022615 [Candidatus Chloroploca sp. M-50]|uniref:Uncharacterized protein n=1 Tax=Candidatus Chloroploca mongolica TaxID=2528176 RepID=A0ABS4DGG4_9CHLR|nr:hypothetical protein [Candidatus Chloroploca mongolica]MBP1468523.1 hypothetical protein [Candidatus Chloroploca mongolica]